MDVILSGALAMGLAIAGLFFLRFWRETGDRLFALFALAFILLAANRVLLGLSPTEDIHEGHYWLRFLAFALILVAILDKNSTRQKPRAEDGGS